MAVEDVWTVSDLVLSRLAALGVEHFFANAGTDFAPIIESFAKAEALGRPTPRPMTVPFEGTAVAMAHGTYMMTGRAQAVMVHVNVGTANALGNLINAARQRIPLILMAGSTPLTDRDLPGHRNRPIHWGQDAFDQAGMVREYVKWAYELRHPAQAAAAIDRAMQIARSDPPGPVYLTLPREILAMPVDGEDAAQPAAVPTAGAGLDPAEADQLVDWLADAERPLIVTSSAGADPAAWDLLGEVAERYALPVVQPMPDYANLPGAHAMNFGADGDDLLTAADLVLVLDTTVPWIPTLARPREDCRVVHAGSDPLFERLPMRTHTATLAVRAAPRNVLAAMRDGLAGRARAMAPAADARRQRLARLQSARAERLEEGLRRAGPLGQPAVTRAIGEVCGTEAVYLSEYHLRTDYLPLARPRSFFAVGTSGFLGWSLGAAMGARLAAPDRLVVIGLGDGTYILNNPTACHFVGKAESLPALAVVFNNGRWNAVRRANRAMYPDGYAARHNRPPLIDLLPMPAYERIVAAHEGHGERVEDAASLHPALERAARAVTDDGRQAVVNVVMA
ncbi:MAG: thiamine pyrophosphate-requiring protein [Alphaproteobacteria bacterium]